MPMLPFVERAPNAEEMERLRLLLSTFQDGSGQLPANKQRKTSLPGFRDFERACAATFSGVAVESKFFVDVIFPLAAHPATYYGVDCKMRGELRKADRAGLITVELTNALADIWGLLGSKGITQANIEQKAQEAGPLVVEAIESIKKRGSAAYPNGPIVAEKSYYLVLLWNQAEGIYQLYQLPLALPVSDTIVWTCESRQRKKNGSGTATLTGKLGETVLYEWYGFSGGQAKYYPSTNTAIWTSDRFRLEPLAESVETGLVNKARAYFPDKWK